MFCKKGRHNKLYLHLFGRKNQKSFRYVALFSTVLLWVINLLFFIEYIDLTVTTFSLFQITYTLLCFVKRWTQTALSFCFRWRKLKGPPWLYGREGASPVVTTEQRSVTVKAAMHPFGCEAETSLQDLFEYFKRCLQHGEWELANACVPQLVNSTGGLSENLRDIIKAIVCHPYTLKWVTQLHVHKTPDIIVRKIKCNALLLLSLIPKPNPYICVLFVLWVYWLCVYFVDGSLWAVHTDWLGFGFKFWRNGQKSR